MDWNGLVNILLDNVGNLPAYYFVSKPVVQQIGSSEVALRILSAAAGAAGLWFAYKIGETAGGKTGAIAGLWFWVFHPMTIWYARDAKEYTFTLFFAAGTLLFFLAIKKARQPFYYLACMIWMAIGLLSHFFFFVFSSGLLLFLISEIRLRPKRFRLWTLMFLGSLVPLGVWLSLIFSKPEPSLGSGWISPVALLDIPLTLWNLVSGYGGAVTFPSTIFGLVVSGTIFLAILNRGFGISPARLFIFSILAPIIGVYIVSLRRPIYVDRYFIVLLPIFTFLFAQGAALIKEKFDTLKIRRFHSLSFILLILITGAFSAGSALSAPAYEKESWGDLAADVTERGGSRPSLWFSDQASLIPFSYYYQGQFNPIQSETPPVCEDSCWWVLRQPFTPTHAFTQSVNPDRRGWLPALEGSCRTIAREDYETGLHLWRVECD